MKSLPVIALGIIFSTAGFSASHPFEGAEGHERSIIQPNSLEPIAAAQGTALYDWSQSIARVESGGAGYCSAFKVAPNLFLSNHHCAVFKPCEEVIFHLGYEPAVAPAVQQRLKCKRILLMEESLDYALFESEIGKNGAAYPVATLWAGDLVAGQRVFFTSFAGTFTKQIDRSEQCHVVSGEPVGFEEKESITHACDTMPGSSGAPIMDYQTAAVLALHWGGTGDEPWNHAIRMKDILAHIRANSPEHYQLLHVTGAEE